MVGRDQQRKRRRSIRLKAYDYSQPGAYFVTICAQQGACLFGQVVDDQMQLSDAGRMVETVWYELPDHYPGVEIDAFVVMPNHVHGIIVLEDDCEGATPRGRPGGGVSADDEKGQARGPAPTMVGSGGDGEEGQARGPAPTLGLQGEAEVVGATPCGRPGGGVSADDEKGQARGPAPTGGRLSLPDVVHRFKSFTTARYRHGVQDAGWPPFPGRVWQRNYWEHVIRDEEGLRKIREYIENNPARWEEDRLHPDASTNPFAGRPP